MVKMVPRHQLGCITPVSVTDEFHYQFYRICPWDMALVGCPLNLQAFSTKGVDQALEAFWPAFDFLVGRQVDRISLGGIPVSAYAGRPRILKMIEESAKKSAIPTTCDFEESIQAFKHLGVKNVAVTAKWSPELLGKVSDYLGHAGLRVAGVHGIEHTAQEVVALKPQEGVNIALALGREAFRKMPEAEGLLLAGGAWYVMEAVPILEAEFGKPVISNPGSTYWAALKQFGQRPRERGFGRLIDSLL